MGEPHQMPSTMTIEPSFVRLVFRGAVTSHDLQALANDVLAIEAGRTVTPHRLNDFSAMTEPFLTYTAVRAFVARRKPQPLSNVVKSAMVAPRPILLGFARMFQILLNRPTVPISQLSCPLEILMPRL
jgi:hypothetical protein